MKKIDELRFLTSSPTLRKEIPDFSPGETRLLMLTGSCFTDSPTRISTGLKSRMPCGYRKETNTGCMKSANTKLILKKKANYEKNR